MTRREAVRAVVIGAGIRGRHTYGAQALAHPERLRVVGVAEPDPLRRAAMADEHGLAADACFDDWRPLLDAPRRAEAAIVATSDTLHVGPALAALEHGYHLLLEKPMAPDPVDCVRVVEAAERAGCILQISHVLRYAPLYARVAELLAERRLGRLVQLSLEEHVAGWHMAHSFVRGKFRKRSLAAPFLLAKSCHDLDLLCWFAGTSPRRVVSFGELRGFRQEAAPQGAPERCSDGCPIQATCPYDAERFYLGPDEELASIWPWCDVSGDPSRESRRRGLETGPYGRCVYRCDNDVVDQQVVSVDFGNGLTGSFGVHGHASRESRRLHIVGSEGELRGVLDEGWLEWSRPGALETQRFRFDASPIGHFGGDPGLFDHFCRAVALGAPDAVLASGQSALESHLLGFAAERSRERNEIVDLAQYRAEIESNR
jgi:predicted dehydrogenase